MTIASSSQRAKMSRNKTTQYIGLWKNFAVEKKKEKVGIPRGRPPTMVGAVGAATRLRAEALFPNRDGCLCNDARAVFGGQVGLNCC